jgi:hypothetical protein
MHAGCHAQPGRSDTLKWSETTKNFVFLGTEWGNDVKFAGERGIVIDEQKVNRR